MVADVKALWIAVVLAIGTVGTAEVADIPLFNEGDEAAVTAALVADASEKKSLHPCDITIAQYGPGERWYGHTAVYECATAARALPNHILTSPLGEP